MSAALGAREVIGPVLDEKLFGAAATQIPQST